MSYSFYTPLFQYPFLSHPPPPPSPPTPNKKSPPPPPPRVLWLFFFLFFLFFFNRLLQNCWRRELSDKVLSRPDRRPLLMITCRERTLTVWRNRPRVFVVRLTALLLTPSPSILLATRCLLSLFIPPPPHPHTHTHTHTVTKFNAGVCVCVCGGGGGQRG